jgi:starvation-inducible DNA-binding protein
MEFNRHILEENNQKVAVLELQKSLVDLVETALQLKQAHWNVKGKNFRSVHLELDEIIETVRAGSDEVAERIVALGTAADGRSATLVNNSRIDGYPEGFVDARQTLKLVADRLAQLSKALRSSIEEVGQVDPISEDLLIGIAGQLEKHLWMVQAQEEE